MAFPWIVTRTGPGGFLICVFIFDGGGGGTRRLTESGFMQKLGIEPASPGLQNIGLSPTPQLLHKIFFLKVVLWRSQESNLRPISNYCNLKLHICENINIKIKNMGGYSIIVYKGLVFTF